jgi:hypothetical protein
LERHLPTVVVHGLGLDALCPWERRARSCVSLGRPSSGGQRTDAGGSSRPLACVVTSWSTRLPAIRAAVLRSCFHSQTAKPESSGMGFPVATGMAASHLCPATLAALGHQSRAKVSMAGLTETATTPVRQSRASVTGAAASRFSHPSARGWRAAVGASPAPNHSVKGTSCAYAQAAPYLER